MVATRRLTKAEADNAIELDTIRIPPYPRPAHPFSRGALPDLYSIRDLEKDTDTDSFRLGWFSDRLCAIQFIIGNAVPFYFKEQRGALRSLDVGCLGHLRQKPNLLHFGQSEGVIPNVRISEQIVAQKTSSLERIHRH